MYDDLNIKDNKPGLNIVAAPIFKNKQILRPSQVILEKLVDEMPLTKIGEKYGVSNNAVKKWCKTYKIPLKGLGYWRKVETGKIII